MGRLSTRTFRSNIERDCEVGANWYDGDDSMKEMEDSGKVEEDSIKLIDNEAAFASNATLVRRA